MKILCLQPRQLRYVGAAGRQLSELVVPPGFTPYDYGTLKQPSASFKPDLEAVSSDQSRIRNFSIIGKPSQQHQCRSPHACSVTVARHFCQPTSTTARARWQIEYSKLR
jgi:hypothetical protein